MHPLRDKDVELVAKAEKEYFKLVDANVAGEFEIGVLNLQMVVQLALPQVP